MSCIGAIKYKRVMTGRSRDKLRIAMFMFKVIFKQLQGRSAEEGEFKRFVEIDTL